ncbi:hypothetical protein SAMN05444002_4004 [Vannielia litorea]|uniref:Uncharacterized protein n=2 Tax=Vannielia litorea TaxID=1217970 RepID=A0A1N6IKL2_9RHOB|nr:hypothetical protein SAMN05444002_4004 [Vannielia litorea]
MHPALAPWPGNVPLPAATPPEAALAISRGRPCKGKWCATTLIHGPKDGSILLRTRLNATTLERLSA